MAETNIKMGVNIKMNTNSQSKVFGHYFPEVARRGTLSTVGFAKHMAEHGSLVTEEVLNLVLGQIAKCLPELCSQGVSVKLDGLGIFYPTLQSRPGGAASVEEASLIGAANLVEGVHLRFNPEQTDLRDLTYKAMKKRCSLALDSVVTLQNVTEERDGETVVKRRLKTCKPVGDYLFEQGIDDGGGSGGDDSGDRP